jgi:hypothetical protein
MDLYGAIDWIELIPLSETRNYVQRVLENRVVYSLLLAMPGASRITAVPADGTQEAIIGPMSNDRS